MKFEGKSRRLRERMRLSLPVRVRCRESAGSEWTETTRLIDVTPFGACFALARVTEPGRLLHLTVPLPRQLRCYDHIEDQYRIWALVRHVRPLAPTGMKSGTTSPGSLRGNAIGVAFIGKNPPDSYLQDPATLYEVGVVPQTSGLWNVRAQDAGGEGASSGRSQETRLRVALDVIVEAFDGEGNVQVRERTVTENISRRGAAVWTTLNIERGRFVRVTSAEQRLSVIAAVRARRVGADGIPRLHLEFVDREWPLEGIE